MKNYDWALDDLSVYDFIDNSSITDNMTHAPDNDEIFPIFLNTNSAPSINKETYSYYDAENLKEEYYTMLLERLVYSLLKEGKTSEAKKLLIQYDNYSSPLIDKWKKAFSRHFVTEMRKASLEKDEVEKESAWIKREGKKFVSKWVALVSGKVYATGDNLDNLKKELDQLDKKENITFLKL